MSVVYGATCGSCDGDLAVSKLELDSGDDLIIAVEPCESCLAEKDSEISDLKERVEELEGKVFDLENEVERLEQED